MTGAPPLPAPKQIDAKTFWRALGSKPSAVAVVTAHSGDAPSGFLALSVAHLCADPPLLTVSIDKRTSTLETVMRARHFAVNYLPQGEETLADMFGGRTEVRGADRFAPGRWTQLVTGAPILANALTAFDCRLEDIADRYDTIIAIGRMVDFISREDVEPLVFFRGGYR